jgi:Zn finger protein HypA/HybF involved in hydrogenase expression
MSTHTTGKKPGKGAYTCKDCGQVVVLDDTNDVLPPCPKCSKTTFKK